MERKPVPTKTRQTPLSPATHIAEKEALAALSPSQTQQIPGQSATQVIAVSTKAKDVEPPKKNRKYRRVKRKRQELIPTEINDMPGVRKIIISTTIQIILKCRVGDQVTSEYPWKYVQKETLEDNLELHEESSEFLPLKEDILVYPREEILLIYIPDEMREYDEFYICLTVTAEEAVLKIIDKILQEREERLNNSIWKTVGEWNTLGSENEVQDIQLRNNRPLLEVEIESEYPIRPTKAEFRLRLVQNAKDGYAEILCARQTFINLYRKRLDVCIQVTPTMAQNGSQTVRYCKNAFTQYEFNFPPIKQLSKEFRENMQYFLDNKMSGLADTLYVNHNINFYIDDYLSLVRDKKYTIIPQNIIIKPYTSFIHPKTCTKKEIVCHSWHPMWSGTIAIAYAYHKLCDYRKYDSYEDEVKEATYNVAPVLLWSLQDNLDPKLFLETPREITQLSWCPYDENLLVGGCASGQVVIWDVTDRLKGVEEEEILTIHQKKYRTHMTSFMDWMKNTKDLKRVRCTVVSELEYSHRSAVTAIRWLSTHREISKCGQIDDIPQDENRTSLQFLTASRDGTVVAWDLLAKPLMRTSMYRPQKKLRRLKKRPSALTVAVSPYRILNRVFKPIFKVNVPVPHSTRLLPITQLSIRVAPVDYVEKYPDPNRPFNITDRIIYQAISKIPTHPLINQFIAGSTEGDFLVASWEGFDFNAGEVVNKETCKFQNFGKYHDGPVLAISRSELFPDLILTVGGKVFALWKLSLLGKPVMWRRCKVRYTHGVWNSFRPSIFRLSREDGYMEFWHLRTRSDRYTSLVFVSREGLGMTTTHPRIMKQNILGVVGTKGFFEVFYVNQNFTLATEEDKWSTYRICEREFDRKTKFIQWQQHWLLKHADQVKAKQEQNLAKQQQNLAKQQQREEEIKLERAHLKEEEEELKKEISEALAKASTPEPGHFSEWASQQLLIREKERMMKKVLRKKHLDLDKLIEQRIPLMQLEKEEKKKKANQEKRGSMAGKLFKDTVAMLFPETIEKKPPPPHDPYAGGDSNDVKAHYFKNYLEMSKEYEDYVKERQYNYHFNWLTLLQSGKERRRSMYEYNSHKLRILKEKMEKRKGSGVSYSDAEAESQTSLGSIDYIITSDGSVAQEQNDVELDDID